MHSCSAQPPSPLSSSSSSAATSASIPQQQQQHNQHPPRCIAADSYHTYICTENSEATRRAIQLFASNGSIDGHDNMMNDSAASTTSRNIVNNKHTLPTTSSSSSTTTTTTTTTISPHEMDLGVEQRITGSETEQANIRTTLKKMHVYLEEEVYSRSEYEVVRMNGKCKNYHELCAFWSSVGECETNRIFMMENCVAACRLCLLASVNLMA